MTLNEKLATIQTKFKSKKSRFNSFGKYNFRSAEDILEATKPFLLQLGVSVTINEQVVLVDSPFPMIESKATITDGESAIHATAIVGVDLAQKGMQMPQKFGSASSYGKKYALGNLFLIDDTADSDATNSHGKAPAAKTKNTLTSKKDPAYTKAKDYIKAGGKVEAIKAKYALSKEIEAELTTL
jgi:ribosomal protein L31